MGGLLDRYGRAREQTGRGAPHRLLRSPASTRPAYAQGVDDVERERRERMLAPEEMGDGETSERAILGLSQIDLHAREHETAHWPRRRSARRRLSDRRAKSARSRIHQLFNSWSPGAMVGRGRGRVPVTANCSVDASHRRTVLMLLTWTARDSESDSAADHSKGTSLAEVPSSSVDASHLGVLTWGQGGPRSPPDGGLTGHTEGAVEPRSRSRRRPSPCPPKRTRRSSGAGLRRSSTRRSWIRPMITSLRTTWTTVPCPGKRPGWKEPSASGRCTLPHFLICAPGARTWSQKGTKLRCAGWPRGPNRGSCSASRPPGNRPDSAA